MRKIKKIHVHHMEYSYNHFNGKNHDALMSEVLSWHKARNFGEWIGYHYVVFPDGVVKTGRPVEETPCSIAWHNTGALAVCMFGHFDVDVIREVQLHKTAKLIAGFLSTYELALSDIIFHRELDKKKSCPGRGIKKDEFINLVSGYYEKILKTGIGGGVGQC